jgi:S1-C subfamily serine protease
MDITATLDRAPGELGMRGERFMMPDIQIMPFRQSAFLGVQIEESEDGVTVTRVVPNSAAEEAGLQDGDVITAVDGQEVTTPQALQEAIATLNPGDVVTLTITRDGQSQEVEATLGGNSTMMMPGDGHSFVIPATPGLFRYLPEENAYEVGELLEDSPYYEAGLRSGDRITAINGEAFDRRQMRFELHGEENVTLTVERDGETLEVDVPGTVIIDLLTGGMLRMTPDGFRMPEFRFEVPRNPRQDRPRL